MKDTDLLYQAVQYLSGQCDGARTLDGAGWNRWDSAFGKMLAGRSFEIWTAKQKRAVWKAMGKYRAQLLAAGINYNAIPVPPEPSRSGGGAVRLRGVDIVITFPYRADLVLDVRTLPHRRWNAGDKVWTLPADPGHAAIALDFARKHDFDIDDNLIGMTNGHVEPVDNSDPISVTFKDKTIELKEDFAAVRFAYNEYLKDELKRSIPGQLRWHKASMAWQVPLDPDSLEALLNFADQYGFEGDLIRIRELSEKLVGLKMEAIEASQAAKADIEVQGLGWELMPFQKAGVKYAMDRQRCFIADEQGLGKTIEGLATIHALNAYPCLVICMASVKLNWFREARKGLLGKTFCVLGGKEAFGRITADVVIINFDQLKKYQEFLIHRGFQSLIIDESQNLKGAKTIRTETTEQIAFGCLYGRTERGRINRRIKDQVGKPIPVRLCLSGTPLMNRPDELPPQLRILDRLDDFGGWYKFTNRYCGRFQSNYGIDTSGHGNLLELNTKLRSICMVRRLKSEVLKELPPKVRTIVPVEITNRAEYDRAETNLIKWLRETKGEAKADAGRRAEQLVRIEALKQLAAQGKMKAVTEWTEAFLEGGGKLVMAAWHHEVLDDISRQFRCDKIDGRVSIINRQAAIDAFQDNDHVRLIAIQLKVIGITLTAASNIGCVELGWNPPTMDQIEDRCHRIGQTDSVNAYWFIGQGTIDEDIAELIEEKRKVIDAAMDGKEPTEDTSIMNQLVDRLSNRQETQLVLD